MANLPSAHSEDIVEDRIDEDRGVRVLMLRDGTNFTLKFTPERVDRIVEALNEKNPMTTAADYAGISRRTLYDWLETGEDCLERHERGEDLTPIEQEFADFYRRLRKARVSAERAQLDKIIEAGESGTWQASAWWLERVHPDKYSRRQKVDHSGRTEKEITITLNTGDSKPRKTDIGDLESEIVEDVDYEIEEHEGDGDE